MGGHPLATGIPRQGLVGVSWTNGTGTASRRTLQGLHTVLGFESKNLNLEE